VVSQVADCKAAIVMETQPRFLPPGIDYEERKSYWDLFSPLALLYEAKLFHLTGVRDLSKETMEVYWDMRDLTGQKEVAIHSKHRVEILSYSDMVERLVRRIIALVQSEGLKSLNHNSSIFVLFGNAALLHIYMFMKDGPGGCPFCGLVATRLRTRLEAVNLAYFHKEYPELMLWILIMGGLGSFKTADRRWYAKLLAQACMASGLQGGDSIAHVLAEFLWSELYRSPVTIGFWTDVAEVHGMNSGYEVKRSTDHISAAVFNAPPVMKN